MCPFSFRSFQKCTFRLLCAVCTVSMNSFRITVWLLWRLFRSRHVLNVAKLLSCLVSVDVTGSLFFHGLHSFFFAVCQCCDCDCLWLCLWPPWKKCGAHSYYFLYQYTQHLIFHVSTTSWVIKQYKNIHPFLYLRNQTFYKFWLRTLPIPTQKAV